jgi:hypothetical protein
VGASWIAGVSLTFAFCELSLAGNAPLQSRTNFVTGLLFEGVCATADEREIPDRNQDRPGLHPLILGTKHRIANCRMQISNCRETTRTE